MLVRSIALTIFGLITFGPVMGILIYFCYIAKVLMGSADKLGVRYL